MSYILLILGLFLGAYLKDLIPKALEKYVIIRKNTYKVKFNVYFVIHRNGSTLNEIVRTETIEISVRAKDEDEVNSLVNSIIKDDIKLEIESVELI